MDFFLSTYDVLNLPERRNRQCVLANGINMWTILTQLQREPVNSFLREVIAHLVFLPLRSTFVVLFFFFSLSLGIQVLKPFALINSLQLVSPSLPDHIYLPIITSNTLAGHCAHELIQAEPKVNVF